MNISLCIEKEVSTLEPIFICCAVNAHASSVHLPDTVIAHNATGRQCRAFCPKASVGFRNSAILPTSLPLPKIKGQELGPGHILQATGGAVVWEFSNLVL